MMRFIFSFFNYKEKKKKKEKKRRRRSKKKKEKKCVCVCAGEGGNNFFNKTLKFCLRVNGVNNIARRGHFEPRSPGVSATFTTATMEVA